MLCLYYFCKKYETTGSIGNQRGRDRKPKTSAREDSMNIRIPQEKNVKRDSERLEIECVSSNSFPYNQKPTVDRLYPKKKTIRHNTSANKTW
ncbi:hypothetical protein AVEN_171432-1 [Araneus ventricosus]|uniref:Uncharacterized protein n=1 Tax=Araneus ventricosus TaxID=182803 RepID=A0A4Y2D4C1_ARAVE|nr:hypothetical protein AVEN_171432-1 [Araneus ventricosus]